VLSTPVLSELVTSQNIARIAHTIGGARIRSVPLFGSASSRFFIPAAIRIYPFDLAPLLIESNELSVSFFPLFPPSSGFQFPHS